MISLEEFLSLSPFELREYQKDILTRIYNNFNKYKYFIIEAPTGIGKSLIGYMFSQLFNKSLLLTNTKLLQDQYKESFKDLFVLKGKSAYRCYADEDIPVDKSPCSLSTYNCKAKQFCKYHKDYKTLREMKSGKVLTSYASFLSNINFSSRSFDCIVCDEAHTIEDLLVGRQGFKLDKKSLEANYNLRDFLDSSEVISYLLAYTEDNKKGIIENLTLIKDLIGKKLLDYDSYFHNQNVDMFDLDDFLKIEFEKFNKLTNMLNKLESFLNSYEKNPKNWVIDVISNTELEIQPLIVGDYFRRMFDNDDTKIMFLSASILDISGFIKELNLPIEQVAVIREKPLFNPKRSPIINIPSGKLSYNYIDQSLPKVVENIKKILEIHKNEKGIILTNNYKVTNYLVENLKDNRILYKTSDKISNEYLIQQHIRINKPTVLISPSMNTGVDLPDDLARFQIIVKMPYGSLGNKRIKEKSKIDNTWYQVDMIRNFIQSCGRGVRSEEDYCVTYVLDSSFYYCIKQNLKYISQIKERIILDKDKFNYDEFQMYLKGK